MEEDVLGDIHTEYVCCIDELCTRLFFSRYNLSDSEWGEFTYQEPSIPEAPGLSTMNELWPEMERMGWQMSHMVSESSLQSPIVATTIANEMARLFAIIHDSLSLLYGRAKNVISAVNILNQYRRYEAWRNQLPQELRSVDDATQQYPHILSIQ